MHHVVSPCWSAMATTGAGNEGDRSASPNPSVVEMLQNLNLTAEEGAVMDFADDEEEEALAPTEWRWLVKFFLHRRFILTPCDWRCNLLGGIQ